MSRVLITDARGPAGLLGAFNIVAALIALFLAYRLAADPSLTVLAAGLVAAGSLVPVYLWCAGHVGGVPLFPLFSLTYLWTYAYPLASGNPEVESFESALTLSAGLTVAAALLVGAFAWYIVLNCPYRLPARIREMQHGKGDWLLIAMIFGAALLTAMVNAHMHGIFSEGIFGIVRSSLLGLSAVGMFALAYRLGRGELERRKQISFVTCFVAFLIAQMATLLLVSGLAAVALFAVGYAVGAGRIPWKWLVPFLAVFALLHVGKGEMREHYWYPPQAIQPWQYPAFFAEWLDHGVHKLVNPDPSEPAASLYERVGLVHLLLRVLDEAPERTPYLMGETYAVIPELLVPRLFNPDKPSSHEGTTILNVHYGLQTREDTLTTTIGWGLLNEAVANFGPAGSVLFGLVTGVLFGWITRVTSGASLLSLRMLVAITFMAFAIQSEFTAGVYVTALFQSLVALFAASLLFMRRGGAQPRSQSAA
jgi:hypothetical protein